MSWIYKSRSKIPKTDIIVGNLLCICPKCHYILLVRDGERPLYCPMCGSKNLREVGDKDDERRNSQDSKKVCRWRCE